MARELYLNSRFQFSSVEDPLIKLPLVRTQFSYKNGDLTGVSEDKTLKVWSESGVNNNIFKYHNSGVCSTIQKTNTNINKEENFKVPNKLRMKHLLHSQMLIYSFEFSSF